MGLAVVNAPTNSLTCLLVCLVLVAGKTPLRQWVTRLLAEMQESIETHINNAMKGQRPPSKPGEDSGADSGVEDATPRSRRNSDR